MPTFHAVTSVNINIIFVSTTVMPLLPSIQVALRQISLNYLHRQFVNEWIMKINDVVRRRTDDFRHVSHALERTQHRASDKIVTHATETSNASPTVHLLTVVPMPCKTALT